MQYREFFYLSRYTRSPSFTGFKYLKNIDFGFCRQILSEEMFLNKTQHTVKQTLYKLNCSFSYLCTCFKLIICLFKNL